MPKHTFPKNVYSFFRETEDFSQNILFERNNLYRKNYGIPPLLTTLITKERVTIWLSAKGEFCYRIHPSLTIHTIPLKNASTVLSNFLKGNIQIIKQPKSNLRFSKKNQINYEMFDKHSEISIKDLALVEKDIFAPCNPEEFFSPPENNLIYYRNTFLPSDYLQLQFPKNYQWQRSITLQYIYYLANYQQDRFNFIMHWLAAFFKNLKHRSKIALVFLGNKESGKEILFDEIIKPLFGQEYCFKITDNTLDITYIQKLLKNKLFYNIDNLSDTTIKDKKIKNTFNDLLSKDTITVIENKESIVEYPKYGQTIITIDEARLPSYIDKYFESYSLFKIPDDFDSFDINESENILHLDEYEPYVRTRSQLIKISKPELIDKIKKDLQNFSLILKGYKVNPDTLHIPFDNDDKKYLQNNLEDKLQAFHEAILNHQTSINYFDKIKDKDTKLYKVLTSDFDKKRIEQPNLFSCFALLYPEEKIRSGRTLMVKLRKIDTNFYNISRITSQSGGKKYFELQ